MHGRKATIYDIAQISGASPSTVSAALGENWRGRRISKTTVEEIRRIAAEQGYSPNMQARGLRKASSSLVGLILPLHDNRHYASVAQHFELMAREQELVPFVASSRRDADEEQRLVETMVAYAFDFILIAGATNPEAISELCASAGLRHAFIDKPGTQAPSIMTDYFAGAVMLTDQLVASAQENGSIDEAVFYYFGGADDDDTTSRKVDGFKASLRQAGIQANRGKLKLCGHTPEAAHSAIVGLHDEQGFLPRFIFANSSNVLEGVIRHLVDLSPEQVVGTEIACFDYDPLAVYLQFPVHMVRQDSRALIEHAYKLMIGEWQEPSVQKISPKLIPPRTVHVPTPAERGWG